MSNRNIEVKHEMDEVNLFMKQLLASGTLNCHVCKKLMIPPVWLSIKSNNYCDRCYETYTERSKSTFFVGNTALDAVLQKLPYPCEYYDKGCKQVLQHPDYKQHILQCRYGPVSCPADNCNWTGFRSSWLSHSRKNHATKILKEEGDSFLIPYSCKDSNTITFLQTVNGEFLVRVRCIQKTLKMMIVCLDPSEVLEGTFFIQYRTDPQELRSRECPIETDIGALLNWDTNTRVTKINFKADVPELQLQVVYKLRGNLSLMPPSLLDYYRCYTCEEYMKMEIWECSRSHMFCADCFYRHGRNCSTKMEFTKDTPSVRRNEAMLPLARNFLLPCCYSKFGCKIYVRPLTDAHEKNCAYDCYQCPLDSKCSIRTSHRTLLSHITEHHQDICIGRDEQQLNCSPYGANTLALIVDDKVFRVLAGKSVHGRNVMSYIFVVEEVGRKTGDRYVFTVSVLNVCSKASIEITTRVCGSIVDFNPEAFEDFFVSDDDVTWSISVRKV